MATMSKKKPKPEEAQDGSGDRHKPSFMVRIPERFRQLLELLAERRVTDKTTEVVRAVREMLEREGLWPPKGEEETEPEE